MEKTVVRQFIEQSKLGSMGPCGREQGQPLPAFEKNPEGTFEKIALPRPDPAAFPALDVAEAIERRESVREYGAEPMRLSELSLLLWLTQGVKRVIPNIVALRNVPSAGARNALETFLAVNRVEGLESGLYKYVALEHALLKIQTGEELPGEFALACDEQDQVKDGTVTFLWTAVPDRMTWSYSERSYRYLFLDAGHVCQNLYLAAEKLGFGVCAIGHYDDDRINELLGIDGVSQFTAYAASVGKKRED